MNNNVTPYTIGVIGFERAERRVLRHMVGLSENRQPSFKPFDKERGGCPHLILVDADRPSAISAWNRFRRANAPHACFSPVFVGRNLTDLPYPDPYVLRWPILTTELFSVLNEAVSEVHGYRPAASTGDSNQDSRTKRTPEFTALVVDDSLPVRVQMRGVLSSVASHVDFAETGKQALRLIDAQRYSIIFIDAVLPDEHAFEICDRIKKHPLQQEAAVIMLTSSSSPADRVMSMLAGFDNYLVKPIQRAMFDHLAAALVRPAAVI